jgi:hypothetical protein
MWFAAVAISPSLFTWPTSATHGINTGTGSNRQRLAFVFT